MSLSQIGEFSFIIATLGLALGVTSNLLYPIAVAVSVVTTFMSPYMIRSSTAVSGMLERRLPRSWVAAIERYSQQAEGVKTTSDWRKLLRAYGLNLGAFALLSVAGIFLGRRHLPTLFEPGIGWLDGTFIAGLVTLLALVPCIWAMSFRRIQRGAYRHLWLNKRALRGPLIAIELVRVVAAVVVVALLVYEFFGTGLAFVAALIITVVAVLIFRRKLQGFYQRLEERFLLNFYQRENRKRRPALAPWDLHLAEIELPQDSVAVGRSLQELALREKHGVNIALIERDERTIPVPGREERLLPGDNLVLIGTDAQLVDVNRSLARPITANGDGTFDKTDIRLEKYRVLPRSLLIGRTIRESGIREQGRSLITGIERGDQRIVNPESTVTFQQDDLIWLVGDAEAMHAFMADGKGMLE
jgi:monovalent cation:H+ antiporter-2, CPA2 family